MKNDVIFAMAKDSNDLRYLKVKADIMNAILLRANKKAAKGELPSKALDIRQCEYSNIRRGVIQHFKLDRLLLIALRNGVCTPWMKRQWGEGIRYHQAEKLVHELRIKYSEALRIHIAKNLSPDIVVAEEMGITRSSMFFIKNMAVHKITADLLVKIAFNNNITVR